MLTESLTLSCGGLALGLAPAVGGTWMLAGFEATAVPLLQHVRVDGQTLGFALLAALPTGLVFGLASALRVSAADPHGALNAGQHRVLFGVTFSDRPTYAAALGLLAAAATLAGYLPARRASRVDPLEALRCE